jgi:hypothetical protein
MQKADEIYFNELVQKYMADEFTEAQAQYLAYLEMGFDVPSDVEQQVRNEEMSLDMTAGYLPLKVRKKIKRNPLWSNLPLSKKYNLSIGEEIELAVFTGQRTSKVIVLVCNQIKDDNTIVFSIHKSARGAAKSYNKLAQKLRCSIEEGRFFVNNNIESYAVVWNDERILAHLKLAKIYGIIYVRISTKAKSVINHLVSNHGAKKVGEYSGTLSMSSLLPKDDGSFQHSRSKGIVLMLDSKDVNYANELAVRKKHILNITTKNDDVMYDESFTKPNPKRKYFVSKDEFDKSYKKNNGNYDAIKRELFENAPENFSVISSVENLSWWSREKYPPVGSVRKYSVSEEEFKKSYYKHDGNYSVMAKELIGTVGTNKTLLASVKNLSWWSKEKYPSEGSHRKYYFTEEEFKEAYNKHNGNYCKIAREILNLHGENNGLILKSSVAHLPWWSKEKYPSVGSARKYHIDEKDFIESYNKNGGNYSAMERELLPDANLNGSTLYRTIQNQPWAHKYPRLRKKADKSLKKKLNRGQYQNAVSMALASKIGMNVESGNDKEISADADLLLKDILDLASEGLSIEKIAEELNIEKAIVKRALEGQVQKKSNPEITYENSEELRGFINSLNDNEKKVFDFIKKRKKPYNLPKELYSTYNKLLEKYSLFLSNNVFVDGKRINIDSLDLDKNILLKEFSNPNIFYSIDESKKGKDYKKNTGMVLFLFAKELDKYSPYDIAEMVEYGLYKRTASVFMDESQNELFEKNVVSIIEYKYQPCEVSGCENMNEIYIAAMSTNPSYARNKIMVFLLMKLMTEYNTKILNFGFTYSDGEELLKYLNSKGIANVYSLKAPLVIKPNPIKSQKTASGDIRVFRTEDDKFVTVKKEKGCYGVYPDGKQFKRIGAPNKQAALAKAREILMRKNNPTNGLIYHSTSIWSFLEIIKQNNMNVVTTRASGRFFSFTRDKLFQYKTGISGSKRTITMIFDYEKLKRDYDIAPYMDRNFNKFESDIFNKYGESEERVMTNEIKNIKKYLVKAILNVDILGFVSPMQMLGDGDASELATSLLGHDVEYDVHKYPKPFYVKAGEDGFPEVMSENLLNDLKAFCNKYNVIIDARNKKDWMKSRDTKLDKMEIKSNPGEAYPIRVTSVDSLKAGDKVQFLMPKIVTKQKIRSSDGARINIPFHVGFFDELFTEATVEDINAESGKIQLSSDQSGLEVMTLDIGLFIKSRVYRKSRLGEARKNNPDESMGIKRSHEDVSEVGEDIKQLIVSLYTGGESIERIARRVDLNQSGVRQILEDNNVTIRKGGWKEKVKPNPKRKYFISEEIFSESYTRNQGNYGAIARELIPGHHGDSSTLISSVEGSKWWNREKYPPRGTIRKYIFTEEEINNVYNKYDGDYSKMEKELIPGVNRFGATLYNSIRKAPWFSKYPRKERKSKTGQLNMSKKERKSNPFFSLVEDQKKNN